MARHPTIHHHADEAVAATVPLFCSWQCRERLPVFGVGAATKGFRLPVGVSRFNSVIGEAAEGEPNVVEHNRHNQSTSQRCQGISDVGPSHSCLRSRVDGLFAGDVERGSKQTHDSCKPPVIWFQSPSPWIGPSLISKVELPVFSLVAPSKPLNNPLVLNKATASPVGPDGQKLCSFDSSSLVGTSTAANGMPCSLILLPRGGSPAVRTVG